MRHGDKSNFIRNILKDNPSVTYTEAEEVWVQAGNKAPLGESNFRRLHDEMRRGSSPKDKSKKKSSPAAKSIAAAFSASIDSNPAWTTGQNGVMTNSLQPQQIMEFINKADVLLDAVLISFHEKPEYVDLQDQVRDCRRSLYKLIP